MRKARPPVACAMEARILQLRREELAARLALNRLETLRARRAAAAAARTADTAWRLPDRLRNTVVIIYDMSGHRTEPAVCFLQAEGRRRQWPELLEAALHLMVETIFVGMIATRGAPAVAAMVNPTLAPDILSTCDAQRWVEEWLLFAWAKRQNIQRGVAPSTAELLDELARIRTAWGGPPTGTTNQSRVRQWGTAFRRRWNGRFGFLPAKECVPLVDMRTKVVPRNRWRWLCA